MTKLEKILSRWNFKKIVFWYLILDILAGLACAGTVGYLYRERLNFAWQYSHLKEAKGDTARKNAAEKTAAASDDVVDVLILDSSGQVIYSAKNSEFAVGTLKFVKTGSEKKYLILDTHPDAIFQYVKGEEFMLGSILHNDFGTIRSDYDDNSAFESGLSSKTIYMLSKFKIHGSDNSVYVITIPTSVSGGALALKTSAALATLFFCVYWVLIALWLYKDAAKCRLSPLYWGLIGLFTNLIGLIVYLIYKRSMAVCPSCGTAQNADHLYCSFCGTPLGVHCEHCGCKIDPEDKYCHHCGSKIQ